jgi:APA family basic amino acid/polyamine antiporter
MNPFGVFVLMVFAIGLYPHADIAYSTILAVVPALFIALTYVLFSIAMPRTGGDYVWVSRIIHPVIGFMVNFGLTFVLFTFIAIDVTVFTQWGVGAYFYGTFVNTGNSDALNIFSLLNQPGSNVVFGIALLLILLISAVVAFGTRLSLRVQKFVWAFVILAALIYVGLGIATNHSAFVSSFDSKSGTTEAKVISDSVASGFDPTVTLEGALLGFVYMFLNFTGFNYSSYVSGEIRDVRKSQIIGILLSLIVFAALLVLIVKVTQNVFGYNFFNGLSYLFDQVFYGINPAAPYPSTLPPPFPEFLVGFLTSNQFLIFIITMGFGLSILVNAVPYVYVATRNIFAWSFDRCVPASLSRVDSRFRTPYVAVAVVAILSVLITYLSVYTTISLLFTYITFLFALLYSIVGISAMVFPLKRNIFEMSPEFVKRRVGGIPVISIVGFLALVSSAYVGYSLFSPNFSGPFVLQNFEVVLAVLIAPILIYFASYYYYKSKDIPVELMQKEIPPE